MFSGFFGLNRAYVNEDRNASPFLLALFMWLTGVGSCAGIFFLGLSAWTLSNLEGFNAALNAAARNFPDARGPFFHVRFD